MDFREEGLKNCANAELNTSVAYRCLLRRWYHPDAILLKRQNAMPMPIHITLLQFPRFLKLLLNFNRLPT
jgi:hypothetical protein